MIPWSGTPPVVGNPIYYVEDMLGTSRVMTQNNGVVCYDADFYPYGGERSYTNTCPQNYKFEGKERDTETGNDDFGARYYSNRFGRWLSADWSAIPSPVPYANLTNPQTLNLYAMVADDPESFADLDGHGTQTQLPCDPRTSGCPQKEDSYDHPSSPDPPAAHQQTQPAQGPDASKTIAAYFRYGEILSALGAVGNGAQAVSNATSATVSVQVGNVQVDNKGESSAVVGVPALAINANVTVNGQQPGQTLIEQPSVGIGKFVQVGTNLVQDQDGTVHTQGGTVSIGVSTPTAPVSSTVPTGNVHDSRSLINRAVDAVKDFFRPAPGLSPSSVPWGPQPLF